MNAAKLIAVAALAFALTQALAGCARDGMLIPEVPDYVMEGVPGPNDMGRVKSFVIDDNGTICIYSLRYHPLTWYSVFLLVSTDKGESWVKRSVPDRYCDFLAAGKDGSLYLYNSRHTMLRSVDLGKSWENISAALPKFVSYPGYHLWPCVDGNTYLSVSGSGIYLYDDSARAWASVFDSLPWGDIQFFSTAVDEAGRFYGCTEKGLWRHDGEGGWRKFDDPPELTEGVTKIIADGRGGIHVLNARKNAVISSRYGGETWDELYPGFYVRDFFVDRQDRIFVWNYDVAAVSADGGFTFEEILQGRELSELDIHSHPDGDVFIYSRSGPGFQRSVDGALTWETIGFPYGDIRSIFCDSEGDFYALLNRGGIWRREEGAEWNCLSDMTDMVDPYCMAEGSDGRLVAGTTRGVFASPRGASEWERVGGDNLTYIREIVFTAGGRIAARREIGIYLLDETGTSWIDIGMRWYQLTSIADFNGDLYASANFGGVFRYTGVGAVWEQVNAGLGDLAVIDMAVLPGAGLFALTKNKGLFLLKEGTSCWEKFYHDASLEMTVLYAGGDILYIGTAGRGIFWTCAAAATIFECGIDVPADAIQDLSLIRVEAIQEDDSGTLYILDRNYIYRARPIRAGGSGGDR